MNYRVLLGKVMLLRKWSFPLKEVLLTCVCLMLWGCATGKYIETQSILSQMEKNKRKLLNHQHQVQSDFEAKKDIYSQLLQAGADQKKDPYPQLVKILNQMEDNLVLAKQRVGRLHRSIYLIKKEGRGKAKIYESDKEWKWIDDYYQLLKEADSQSEIESKEFYQRGEKFMEILHQYQISVVDVNNIKERVLPLFKSLFLEADKTIHSLRDTEYNASLLSSDKRAMNKSGVEKVVQLREEVFSLQQNLIKMKNQFEGEILDKTEMPVAPFMASYQIESRLSQIQLRLNQIKVAYNRQINLLFGG